MVTVSLKKKKLNGSNQIDNKTGYSIAVLKVSLYDKERDVMVAYIHEGEDVKLLTIHPLKEGQRENRIKTGRWRKIQ